MEKEETKIEESTGVYLYGIYANGPDVYVFNRHSKYRHEKTLTD